MSYRNFAHNHVFKCSLDLRHKSNAEPKKQGRQETGLIYD